MTRVEGHPKCTGWLGPKLRTQAYKCWIRGRGILLLKKKSHCPGELWAGLRVRGNTKGPFAESPGWREMSVFFFTLKRRLKSCVGGQRLLYNVG